MKEFELIRSVDQIRSMAREQRLEILQVVTESPLTATMVARALGQPVNQVHYHIRQLVKQGLVVEVEDAARQRKDERFYRAAARRFMVDPGLTDANDPSVQTVRQSVEVSALHARRRGLDLDLGRIARRVVADSLGLARNHRVLLVVTPLALDLAESLLVEIAAVGAESRVHLWSRNLVLQTLERHSPEALATIPFVHPATNRDLDAVIFVNSSIPQGAPPTPEQRETLPLLLSAISDWQTSLKERGVRYLEIALPHRGEFKGGWLTPEEAIDTYWRCLDADAQVLKVRGEAVRKLIGDGTVWRVFDPRGSSLEFAVQTESPHISDGIISVEDVSRGKPVDGLPAGQIAVLPIPASANGTVWSDYTFLGGRHFYDVQLDLREGRIVGARTREGDGVLLEGIRSETGDADLFSGVSIGLNPGGSVLTGRPSLDAIVSGVVTLTFGNNELDGGTVRSTLTLNLPSRSMSVSVDDAQIVTAGALAAG